MSLSERLEGLRANSPEAALIELLFHFSVLCEYQLLDLQAFVRTFVDRMSAAVTGIDAAVATGCRDLATHVASVREALDSLPPSPGREAASTALARVEAVADLGTRVQNDVYTLVECLSFEDIQSQRLDHLVKASSRLNEVIMERLRVGVETASAAEIRAFAEGFVRGTRASYTMPAEREIFDQVFFAFFKRPA